MESLPERSGRSKKNRRITILINPPLRGHNERNNMRIYEVRHLGRTIQFARSFDHAKNVVREDDPKARKISSADYVEYSNGFEIHAIDIKPDKEGILNKLNSLIEQKSSLPEVPEEDIKEYFSGEKINSEDYLRRKYVWKESKEEPKEVEEIEVLPTPPVQNNKTPEGISPAIEFTGNGQGTCLHCSKTVGYVGGFPRVNPPAEILDN